MVQATLRKAKRALTRRAPRKKVANAAYLAGVILLLAGATGNAVLYVYLIDLAAPHLPLELREVASLVSFLLVFLASLGGVSVILGGYLIERGHRIPGKFVVGLGAGSSLLGFLLHLGVVALQGGNPLLAAQGSLSGITAVALALCFWIEVKG